MNPVNPPDRATQTVWFVLVILGMILGIVGWARWAFGG